MNAVLITALNALGSATAAVAVLAIAIGLLLRICRVRSLAIQRFAWLLVLLPGAVAWRLPIVLPILPAEHTSNVDLNPEPGIASLLPATNTSAPATLAPGQQQHPPTAAPRTARDWACVAVLAVWLTGMIVLAARWAHSYAAFIQKLPSPLPPAHEWATELREVCSELRLSRPIPLHVTEQIGPALCLAAGGYRLLIPETAWSRFSQAQRRSILRHELAHYVRGDLWKSLFARLLAGPQWFNPLAWLAVRSFEEAAECACDDAVVAAERDDAFDYLRAIVELGATEFTSPTLQAAIHGGSLQCRVRRLLSPTGKDSPMKKLVVVVAALSLAAGGFARIRLASAQPPAPPFADSPVASQSESPAPDRLASASPARPGQVAFIDLSRTFKEVHAIHQELMAIKERIAKFDQEMKEERSQIQMLRDELKTSAYSARQPQLEKELDDRTATLQTKVGVSRRDSLIAEAKIYNDGFEQIRIATAEYAKQHGIRVVHRSLSSAYAADKAAAENVDITDRKAVLDRINRPVIYADGPSDIPTDITDAIVQKLNASKTR